MLHNIPAELQALNQWVCARADKVPLNPSSGNRASPTDATTWGTFAQAVAGGTPHIGFVLSKTDPYTIIDLDKPETDDQINQHKRILGAFDTYTELSQSGNGLHIVCRGNVPKGCKQNKVEVYSDARYIIFTGNVFKPLPIVDCQPLLSQLFERMTPRPETTLVQIDSGMPDEEIFNRAKAAMNGEKFLKLFRGDWKNDYESQSEADFALISMLCFYTSDNNQVRRIFRYSNLGQRDKAIQNNKYIDRSLAAIRAKEAPLIDFSELTQRYAHLLGKITLSEMPLPQEDYRLPSDPQLLLPEITPAPVFIEAPAGFYPPGFVGDLARYLYSAAIRPIHEIALGTAIGLTAGVVGRTYNISDQGLSQYIMLVAKTGRGKEGIANGIDEMIRAVRSQVTMVDNFIGPSAFASGQALVRVLDKNPCFVSVLGEFGITLQQICDPRANSASQMLKKVLLDIYMKSGFKKTLRESVYSDKDKNTKIVQSPNVTIIGESVPEEFYGALDAKAITGGLLPRFFIIDYDGPRPPKNPLAFQPPPQPLVDQFAALLAIALNAEHNRACQPVLLNAEAQKIFDAFDRECDRKINNGHVAATDLWTRAHLKALKLAALIGVGINPHQPIVTAEAATWAIALTTKDILRLLDRFNAGEIGTGDTKLESDLRHAIKDYLAMPEKLRLEYKTSQKILSEPVVPLTFLRRRLRTHTAFRTHRLGANAALSMTLKAMLEAGELQQVNPAQSLAQFGTNFPLYVPGPNF